MTQAEDARWLARAIELAREGVDAGAGGPFGAVIVQGGRVLAEGHNRVVAGCDPTAHAEVVVIRAACARVGNFHLPGAVLYASCEPCPMCLGAAYWAHVERICFAATRQDAAAAGFDDEMIYAELARPPHERSIPTTQLMLAEATSPFSHWQARVDRTPY